MFKADGKLIYSPSDLIRFMESPFASWMERLYVEFPERITPDGDSDEKRLITETGNRHEKAFVEKLRQEKREICEIVRGAEAAELTATAIRSGREIIYQGYLSLDNFKGYTDFLVRSPDHQDGKPSYEIWDTKLARKTKPYYLVQLCCYAEMLEPIQGERPSRVRVVLGDGSIQEFKTADFFHYYRQLKLAFMDQMARFDPGNPPIPEPRADHGRWSSHAEAKLIGLDHLIQVAGISVGQIKKLQSAGIKTMSELANSSKVKIPKLPAEMMEKLVEQSFLQVETRRLREQDNGNKLTAPLFRVLPPPRDQLRSGLGLLPPQSRGDAYFDMEGFPLIAGGLEYLWGAAFIGESGPEFTDWWAHDAQQEKIAFEGFIDWAYSRWKDDPAMHIYHYAAYEVSAVRRLMGKHATREAQVDDLLRNGVFIDLYQIVRQGLRVGEPSYSIKAIEHLYRPARAGSVATAADSMVQYAHWLELGEPQRWEKSPILSQIRDYNREDCISALQLADWLRARQTESGIAFVAPSLSKVVEAPVDPDKEAKNAERKRLIESLDNKSRAASNDDDRRIHQMLRDLIEFHRREEKPIWWRLFDRAAMTHEELKEDIGCIGDALLSSIPPEKVKLSWAFVYKFDPAQETKIRAGDRVMPVENTKVSFEVVDFDEGGQIIVKVSQKVLAESLGGIMPKRTSFLIVEHVSSMPLQIAVQAIAMEWDKSGHIPPALMRFLLRQPPQLLGDENVLKKDTEDVVTAAVRVVSSMDNSTLCLQGPPGTGKTFTAARMISALLSKGKRVGVTSNSHKAILNVLLATNAEMNGKLHGIKVGDDTHEEGPKLLAGITSIKSSGEALAAYHGGVAAGTAWLFARSEWEDQLDYLFIDEAGQVSIANLVAMSRSAKNYILLGDQMQLEQPIQGSHPGESGASALKYYLQDQATIPESLGLFLPESRRMHPNICRFISDLIYDGRLKAFIGNENRRLDIPEGGSGLLNKTAGMVFSAVAHDGNVQSSDEEVEIIFQLANALVGRRLIDLPGKPPRPLAWDDILFVAPYNMQVRKLKERLPAGARIGSVDKFQGQEAAVVFVSMCSSFGEYGSRGIEFILDQNRMNVALSRAQVLAIVVGDHRIAMSPANSVDGMRRLNLFCRLTLDHQ